MIRPQRPQGIVRRVDVYVRIVLNYYQYGVLYLGSYYNTGPYINFRHFGNSNLGKLPCITWDLA